ncbi:hypothetical protein [Vulcanisaeta distributa]|uniref:hypothetical protein n=1 Tax=Vulcanisaeta distributa TaxID=164451 RepID=UPI000A682161|nr:hypothetical protein [Vulcanisaeta distributa]
MEVLLNPQINAGLIMSDVKEKIAEVLRELGIAGSGGVLRRGILSTSPWLGYA